MSPQKVLPLHLHLLDVDTAWHLETETSQRCPGEPGSWRPITCVTQMHPLAGNPSPLVLHPTIAVVALSQLDMHKETAEDAAEEAPEQACTTLMLTPL